MKNCPQKIKDFVAFCVLIANLLVQYCQIDVSKIRWEVYILADANSLRELAVAIYTVNRHAKTAPDNRPLYQLKKVAIAKLLETGGAEKVGLHFVENPKYSKQHSTVLVRCGEFLFHTLPEKDDFAQLPHLGEQDLEFRNPQERMSLKTARELLTNFTGILQESAPTPSVKKPQQKKTRRVSNTEVFRSSYLDGKR